MKKRFAGVKEDTQTNSGSFKFVVTEKEAVATDVCDKDEEKASHDLTLVISFLGGRSHECSGHDCYLKLEKCKEPVQKSSRIERRS